MPESNPLCQEVEDGISDAELQQFMRDLRERGGAHRVWVETRDSKKLVCRTFWVEEAPSSVEDAAPQPVASRSAAADRAVGSEAPEFAGAALRLTDQDFEDAARRLGCEVAAVRAVAQIESGAGGGFLPDGRPKILFESHKFSRLTGGRFDATHPDISTPTWTRNYQGGAAEYDRLAKAIALDRESALKSASWGMFQILGMNHRSAGHDNVEDFVAAQTTSEGEHLKCFVDFIVREGLADHIKNHEWEEFARRYNGPGYKQNNYDTKLAEAYRSHAVA